MLGNVPNLKDPLLKILKHTHIFTHTTASFQKSGDVSVAVTNPLFIDQLAVRFLQPSQHVPFVRIECHNLHRACFLSATCCRFYADISNRLSGTRFHMIGLRFSGDYVLVIPLGYSTSKLILFLFFSHATRIKPAGVGTAPQHRKTSDGGLGFTEKLL